MIARSVGVKVLSESCLLIFPPWETFSAISCTYHDPIETLGRLRPIVHGMWEHPRGPEARGRRGPAALLVQPPGDEPQHRIARIRAQVGPVVDGVAHHPAMSANILNIVAVLDGPVAGINTIASSRPKRRRLQCRELAPAAGPNSLGNEVGADPTALKASIILSPEGSHPPLGDITSSIDKMRAGDVVVRLTSSPRASFHSKAETIRQPSLARVRAAAPTGPLTFAHARRATRGEALPPLRATLAR
jgi:hypothetical protein